jgi:putative endonuclease
MLRRGGVNRGERVALRHYRLRGYRLLEANARAGRYELDLVLRRGRRILVVEVKEKAGAAFGHPLEMIDEEKARRVRSATSSWLASRPDLVELEVAFEAAAVRGRRVEWVPLT